MLLNKKKTLAIIMLIALCAVVLLFLFFVSPYFKDNPSSTYVTDQEIAVQQTEDAESSHQDEANASQNQPSTSVTSAEPTSSDSRPQVINAPKQEEIRSSVIQERVYYPMKTANDPGYASNWALQKVRAPAAWDISTGSTSTVVAVIDSGFALTHDDLRDRWYTNTAEQGMTQMGGACWTGISQPKQSNNCDDDKNGYKDDWRGWNFVLGDNNPATGRENPNGDAVSHGTETSGLVGATGNNSRGIATINWNTQIMPLQSLSDDGPGYTSDVAAAIYYAVDNGADVINMSLGGHQSDPVLSAATDYAYANNVVVVASSGNCGSGTELGCENVPAGFIGYPARNPHVISVGATTDSNQRASFSSYGSDLDVVAPGAGSINAPTWTSGNGTSLYTTSVYGTSYSAPFVASLASLIKAIRPNSSVDDINALILATSQKTSDMNGQAYTSQLGHGIIDAEKALVVAQALNTSASTPTLLQIGGPVSEHSYKQTTSLGSGCATSSSSSYCTVRFFNESTGHERFLPYTVAGASSTAGWTWDTSILEDNHWLLRAVQGEFVSAPYYLSNK